MTKQLKRVRDTSLLYGIAGSFLFAIGDFVMTYGEIDDITPLSSKLSFLTRGIGKMPSWRHLFSLLIVLPGGALLLTGLLALQKYIPNPKHRKHFYYITIYSACHWLGMHSTYNFIYYAFEFNLAQGQSEEQAVQLPDAMFFHYLPYLGVLCIAVCAPFAYLFWLVLTGKTTFNRWLGFANAGFINIVGFAIFPFIPKGRTILAIQSALTNICCMTSFIILYLCINRNSAVSKNKKSQ